MRDAIVDDDDVVVEQRMAQVVYYLCRNGKVEPPHMIDVPHSSPGLRLRDVKHRLTALRGGRMPAMYAWSFKRVYKNSNIWQDVSGDDLILPISSGEYVLKGSEIVEGTTTKQQPEQPPLQRKFWGAESWLTASINGSKNPPPQFRKHQEHALALATLAAAKSRALSNMNNHPSDRAASAASTTTSGCSIHDPNSSGEVKLYTIKAPDHGCDAATQTEEEVRRRKQQQQQVLDDAAAEEEVRRRKQSESDTNNQECMLRSRSLHSPRSREIVSLGKSPSLAVSSMKKLRRGMRRGPSTSEGNINSSSTTKATKSPSWVLFHVLSYCGGLHTKAQSGGGGGATPLVVSSTSTDYEHNNRDWKTDAEVTSFSDTSRETQGDSFQSSDASDECGRSHKISALVDVKQMVVTTTATNRSSGSPSRSGGGAPRNFWEYGRLSRSGTYYPRDVKYGSNQEPFPERPQGAFKLELNCYRAE